MGGEEEVNGNGELNGSSLREMCEKHVVARLKELNKSESVEKARALVGTFVSKLDVDGDGEITQHDFELMREKAFAYVDNALHAEAQGLSGKRKIAPGVVVALSGVMCGASAAAATGAMKNESDHDAAITAAVFAGTYCVGFALYESNAVDVKKLSRSCKQWATQVRERLGRVQKKNGDTPVAGVTAEDVEGVVDSVKEVAAQVTEVANGAAAGDTPGPARASAARVAAHLALGASAFAASYFAATAAFKKLS